MSQSGKSWLLILAKFLTYVIFVVVGILLYERYSNKNEKEAPVAAIDPAELARIQQMGQKLLVVNYLKPDSPQAQQLAAILAKIDAEKTYGDRVVCRALELKEHPEFALQQGVDPNDRAGQLDFFAEGKKLGSLKGVSEPKIVRETIQIYLDGLIKRYGKGWLPDVPGMHRSSQEAGSGTVGQ